jgi:hypothetical protein
MSTQAHPVGSPVALALVLRDAAGSPILGRAITDFATREVFPLPSGTPPTQPTLAEIGAGAYTASFTPPTPGWWGMRLVYQTATVFREWLATVRVGTAPFPNDELVEAFVLRDGALAPIANLPATSFPTLMAYRSAEPIVTAPVTLAHIRDGLYVLRYSPSRAGDWTSRAVYGAPPLPTHEFVGAAYVSARPGPPPQPPLGGLCGVVTWSVVTDPPAPGGVVWTQEC